MVDTKTSKSERSRAAILKAAQELFAELGYERTTVRDIAARASIDPAMVMRYFGTKEALFTNASAFDLKLPDLTRLRTSQLGSVLVEHFLEVWEGSLSNGSFVVLLRASASNQEAAAKMREVFSDQVVPMLASVVPASELVPRAGLISSQLLGLAFCRYVLKVPPVVNMQRKQVVQSVGPTLQWYIVGKLG